VFVFLTFFAGFVTSIRHHEQKMLLCVETTHKVLRQDSALHIIMGLERRYGSNRTAFIEAATREFMDTIVMTSYNRKMNHVHGVAFDKSPKSIFEFKIGTVTLVEYYKSKYDTKIEYLNQPLLIVRPSRRDMYRETMDDILLVPELCQPVGLTDAMRANFSLMKELGKYFNQDPQERAKELDNFMKRMLQNEVVRLFLYLLKQTLRRLAHFRLERRKLIMILCYVLFTWFQIQKELSSWGMQFDSKMVELNGRILPRETISFAKGTQPVDDKGDFTMAFRCKLNVL